MTTSSHLNAFSKHGIRRKLRRPLVTATKAPKDRASLNAQRSQGARKRPARPS